MSIGVYTSVYAAGRPCRAGPSAVCRGRHHPYEPCFKGVIILKLIFLYVQAFRPELGPSIASLLPAALAACPPGTSGSNTNNNANLNTSGSQSQGSCSFLGVFSSGGGASTVHGVPAALLAKDAVYAALAAGAYELHDYVNFRDWLQGALLAVRALTSMQDMIEYYPRCHHKDWMAWGGFAVLHFCTGTAVVSEHEFFADLGMASCQVPPAQGHRVQHCSNQACTSL